MPELTRISLINDANLVAYYKCENVNDSENGFNLTNNNTVTFTQGKFFNGANFGASNSNKYLSVANDLGNSGGAFSISCWVKLLAEIGSGEWSLVMQMDGGNHIRNEIRYAYNSGTQQVFFSRIKMNIAAQTKTSNLTMGTNNWYHLVYTYDTTNVEGYINGTSIGTTAASGNGATVGSDQFYIGAGSDGTSVEAYSSAIIDDVAIFSDALTAPEVSAIYKELGGFFDVL